MFRRMVEYIADVRPCTGVGRCGYRTVATGDHADHVMVDRNSPPLRPHLNVVYIASDALVIISVCLAL